MASASEPTRARTDSGAERDRVRDAPLVFVVEDERPLAQMVAAYVTRAGFRAVQSHTGPDAVARARELHPDVILLDLGLPGLDGIEVCRQVRTFTDCYVLMLTARGDEVDRIVGLSVGADDYITKPFSARELVARIQAVLRRPRSGAAAAGRHEAGDEAPSRVFGDLVIDPVGRHVSVRGREVQLTRTEFDLLDALSARPRLAFTRRQLIDDVWDTVWVGDEHIVDVHLAHVRRKLGDDVTRARYIETVRGVGYRMGRG